MLVVFYISGHGWGHAARDIELMNAIGRRESRIRFAVRTTVAPWFFDRSGQVPIHVHPIEVDTGVAQIDSVTLDEDETARRAAVFYSDFDRRVANEAAFLRRVGCSVVLADIPPLAFAAAARAGIPTVAVGNFTWDWIYAAYPAFEAFAPDVIARIGAAYTTADIALRLPMHGGFDTMSQAVRDIPYIARRSTRGTVETRRVLGIPDGRLFALASFGSYGLQLPCLQSMESDGLSVRDFGRDLPDGLKYEDLVAAADVVVSKPGYGIISDCLANQTPLLYTSRGHFPEYDVMVAEMPRVLKCRFVSHQDLVACLWADAVLALLAQPSPPEPARTDGAEMAAGAILNLLT